MNNEPSYIIINLDGVRINIMLRSGASLLTLVPKMTSSWRLAECTSPIFTRSDRTSLKIIGVMVNINARSTSSLMIISKKTFNSVIAAISKFLKTWRLPKILIKFLLRWVFRHISILAIKNAGGTRGGNWNKVERSEKVYFQLSRRHWTG